MPPPEPLTPTERFLLEWLSKEDWSRLGECRGLPLDKLLQRGLAEVSTAQMKPGYEDYRGVRLTEAGWKELRNEQ